MGDNIIRIIYIVVISHDEITPEKIFDSLLLKLEKKIVSGTTLHTFPAHPSR